MKRLSILIVVMAVLLITANVTKAEQISALLTGYEETPAAVSTTGRASSPPRSPRMVRSSIIRRSIAGCRPL